MNSNSSSKYSSVSQTSSIAPQDFKVSQNSNDTNFGGHDIEDNSSVIDNLKRCPPELKKAKIDISAKKYWLQCRVCRCNRSTFFCSDCIRNGDFTYSKQRIPERFAEKKLKHFKIKSEQNAICDRIEKQLSNGFAKDQLEFRIRSVEANIEELKSSLIKAKQKLNSTHNSLNKSHVNKNECTQRQRKLSDKIAEAKQYLIRRKNSISKLRESKDKVDSYIKDLVQQRVQQLSTYIFAIETNETVNESNLQNTSTSSESTPLLGTDSISDSNNFKNFNTNYTVVEPWISGNGDYSAFTLYANNDRDLPNRDSNMRNPKHRICAALAYITQMINIISFYLDVRLPKRLSYSEFFANDLNESHFAQKVAKLNVNILYLCLSQGIDTELLSPRQTVKNLLHLVHSSNYLGLRNHSIVIKTDFYEAIESSLFSDLYSVEDTEPEESADVSDENLIIEYDWVENNLPDLHFNIGSQQTSIANNLYSTVSSFFGFKR